MNRNDILDAIRTAAVEILGVTDNQVIETASFADDLNADSLDLVELVMSLEDATGVAIDEEDLVGITTVGDAVDLIVASLADAA